MASVEYNVITIERYETVVYFIKRREEWTVSYILKEKEKRSAAEGSIKEESKPIVSKIL